ncbi:uncharacterized protein LOC123670929 [Harmonia axyridis]|uniref:uncharacterized protein LOC123670929 n=1 Tax=Harmonia axyridis TaxID=115357 RepID=UPI001E276C0A|nr:uncharacterized protein LOC123670929 [Harmonia axyridis]
MYTSYVLKSAVLISVIFSSCVVCDVSRTNCSNYQQVLKENLRNCVFDNGVIGNAEVIEKKTESTFGDLASKTQKNPETWELQLTEKYGLSIRKYQDDLTLQITNLSTSVEARKKRMKVMDIIPYLIIPGFISAGVLPWLIPGMKIAVMGVAMINQMAFTSSLFSLIRGYIFDTSQEDHIVYVNHGYNKYKHNNHLHSHS